MILRNISLRKIVNINLSQIRLHRNLKNNKLIVNQFQTNNHKITSISSKYSENEIKDSIDSINTLPEKQSIKIPSAQLLPNVDPASVPTYNIAAYLKTSESLQQLVNLGVDLSKIEKRKGLGQYILQLDFKKNIKPHLTFLHDIGVPPDKFGEILTQNPLIFKVVLDDLQIRINYLESKKFKSNDISRICTTNPFWLMFSTKRIDRRLGHFQNNFKLSGDNVRYLSIKQPKLITYKMEIIRKSTFCIKEEMGFKGHELKELLLSKPRLWMMNSDHLIERFDYIHNKMKISHEDIVKFPEILTSRDFRIRQRNEYLKLLGLNQYDPSKDLYVSLKKLVEGNDSDFVLNVAKSDMSSFDRFLRTL